MSVLATSFGNYMPLSSQSGLVDHSIFLDVIFADVSVQLITTGIVHRCGTGGSMRACHAAGPGSIPSWDKFPGWGFFRGFSSPVRQMSGSFRPPGSPNIIWTSSSFLIIHYGRQWPEMLTRPKTSNILLLPNVTINYPVCHLPAEIVEVCLFGNKLECCSANLFVSRQTLENKY